MEAGLKISLIGHGCLLGMAAFGGDLFKEREVLPLETVSVEIVSTTEFESILAPAIALPSTSSPSEPETADQPAEPDPLPEPEPEPTKPAVVSEIEQDGEALAQEVVEATPQAADRIADEIVAPPEEPAPTANDTSSLGEEPADEPVEEQEPENTVEEASTTEIVTEADKPSELVPVASQRPPRRPNDLKKPEPKPDPEPVEEARDAVADDILKALQEAEAEQENEPQLSGAQQATLIGVIDAHFRNGWSFTGGVEKGQLPIVEMQIKVFQDGSYAPDAQRLAPANISTLFDQLAVEAALGAIERGRSSPILLTQEFADFIGPEGKDFIIVFDPRRIENKW